MYSLKASYGFCLPYSWPRCPPPGPGGPRQPSVGLPEQPCTERWSHPIRDKGNKHLNGKDIHKYMHTKNYFEYFFQYDIYMVRYKI